LSFSERKVDLVYPESLVHVDFQMDGSINFTLGSSCNPYGKGQTIRKGGAQSHGPKGS